MGRVGRESFAHGVSLPGEGLLAAEAGLRGGLMDGPAPARRLRPGLIERILSGRIHPGRVLTGRIPLEGAAEGYRAMDERRDIDVLLHPSMGRAPCWSTPIRARHGPWRAGISQTLALGEVPYTCRVLRYGEIANYAGNCAGTTSSHT